MDHETNIIKIRCQLESGWRITVQSVRKSVGTQELRHYIPIIRKRFELPVSSVWVKRKGKRFKEYFLSQAA